MPRQASRVRPADGARRIALAAGWTLARLDPGSCDHPSRLPEGLPWVPAPVPGTVAQALGAEAPGAGDLDAADWWYRVRFDSPGPGDWTLEFEGLATLATAWLNGEPLLESRNMHVARRVAVGPRLAADNELVIRFSSLAAAMQARIAPRARWRTALVPEQNLRGFRATFLGRMPGWMPSLAPVGPWRAVSLRERRAIEARDVAVMARVEGDDGRLRIRATVESAGSRPGEVVLHVGEATHRLPVHASSGRVEADVVVPAPPLWWPHTHGHPHLVPWSLRTPDDQAELDAGRVGFRTLRFEEGAEGTRFRVNGVPVFCRGACWTPGTAWTPSSDAPEAKRALDALRAAGANMVRVGGTMVYEDPEFLEACDALGILVWHDFPFANFDYPFADAAFREDVEGEVREALARLARHPATAVLCGGSEVAQQAAMMGQEASRWLAAFFAEELPARCAEIAPGVPYVPNSPWGGALPFHVGQGVAHYYGVGAYRRPFQDLRTARVRFAAECLAFAQVPEPEATRAAFGTESPPTASAEWKSRVPRDRGADWDFEDTRDHYLEVLFGVRASALREGDLARYHDLSRRVPGEVMRRAYAEWRRAGSPCAGALVWLWRDLGLAPGAGWGVLDARADPKAAWWSLRRAWAPRAVFLTDEGLDGLDAHLVNDTDRAQQGTVEFSAWRRGRPAMPAARRAFEVEPRGATRLSMDEAVGYFTDATNAYRFGPPKADAIAVRWLDAQGAVVSEDFHFPLDLLQAAEGAAPPALAIAGRDPGGLELDVSCDRFLVSVAIDAPGYRPSDNYFHLLPGLPRRVRLDACEGQAPGTIRLCALGAGEATIQP